MHRAPHEVWLGTVSRFIGKQADSADHSTENFQKTLIVYLRCARPWLRETMLNKTETFPGIIVRTVQQGVREETR